MPDYNCPFIGLIRSGGVALGEKSENLQVAVSAYEREQIYRVLNKYDWDKAEAANALGIGLSSLYRKIDELGIKIDKQRNKKSA